jgi:hypothetical protein
MKKVQMNLQVPTDVKAFIYDRAKADDRHPAYILEKLIRPMMAEPLSDIDTIRSLNGAVSDYWAAKHDGNKKGDTHKQQSLIPAIDKNEGFDEFWREYPKKKAKAEALKAWKKNDCYIMRGEIIHDVINRAKRDPAWFDKQFVPNAATYLNGARWNDEIIEEDNRPKFQQQNDALRDELFGGEGETYEHG